MPKRSPNTASAPQTRGFEITPADKLRAAFAALVTTTLLASCSGDSKPATIDTSGKFRVYTVQAGETMWSIAESHEPDGSYIQGEVDLFRDTILEQEGIDPAHATAAQLGAATAVYPGEQLIVDRSFEPHKGDIIKKEHHTP